MNLIFEELSVIHRIPVMDIYNYYIENGFSAYPERQFSYDFFDKFLEMTKGYPAYAINLDGNIVGFCYLSAYNPHSTFKETAQITYFISKEFTGKGIGKIALKKLEDEARKMNIKVILAHISSLNDASIEFHLKQGFKECGRFQKIIKKNDVLFDIIWMQKFSAPLLDI
ncbi:MAG: N-acetyltransferase family protein [Bacteroidales bacterium]|nr:N-acetyltransferase family protein [Bacteroidales bacterium]